MTIQLSKMQQAIMELITLDSPRLDKSNDYKDSQFMAIFEKKLVYWIQLMNPNGKYNLLNYFKGYSKDFYFHNMIQFLSGRSDDHWILAIRPMGSYMLNLSEMGREIQRLKHLQISEFGFYEEEQKYRDSRSEYFETVIKNLNKRFYLLKDQKIEEILIEEKLDDIFQNYLELA